MKTAGLGLCWEEMSVGYRFRTVGRTVTETDLVNFTAVTGMLEVLFTDADYARQHAPGGVRIVPGALVYGIAEGLVIQATLQGTGLAFMGMELDMKAPTRVGDTLHVEAEVLESRPTSASPLRGLVRTRNAVVNQNGRTVMVYTPLRLMTGRELLAGHWPDPES
jgi:acyl dehydratase